METKYSEMVDTVAHGMLKALVGIEVVSGVCGSKTTAATAVVAGTVANVAECVKELASLVRAEGERVGAVKLHVLTPVAVMPLEEPKVTRVEANQDWHNRVENPRMIGGPQRVHVFLDCWYELADGSFHLPAHTESNGFYSDLDEVPDPK